MSDDPLTWCCRQLAESQHILNRKDAEIARLRLTDEARWFIERHIEYLIQWTRENGESPSVNQELQAYRGLLERHS